MATNPFKPSDGLPSASASAAEKKVIGEKTGLAPELTSSGSIPSSREQEAEAFATLLKKIVKIFDSGVIEARRYSAGDEKQSVDSAKNKPSPKEQEKYSMFFNLPAEYELFLSLALSPKEYATFKKFTATQRSQTTNFASYYQNRHRELYEEHQKKQKEIEKNKKQAFDALLQNIEKQIEAIDKVQDRLVALGKTTIQAIEDKSEKQKMLKSIRSIITSSVLETKAIFLATKASGMQNKKQAFLQHFLLYKARKEARKKEVRLKLDNYPASIKEPFSKLINLEEACFDAFFKKISMCYEEELAVYDKFMTKKLYSFIADGENSNTRGELAIINGAYYDDIVTMAQKIKDEILQQLQSCFPSLPKTWKENHPTLLHIDNLLNLLNHSEFELQPSSFRYFSALNLIEKQIQESGVIMKSIFLAIKEAIERFKPNGEELQTVAALTEHSLSAFKQEDELPSKTHDETVEQDEKRLKELEQEKRCHKFKA